MSRLELEFCDPDLAVVRRRKGSLFLYKMSFLAHRCILLRCNDLSAFGVKRTLACRLSEQIYEFTPRPAWINSGQSEAAKQVAAPCVYLLSDESGFITGAELTLDGGLTAQ